MSVLCGQFLALMPALAPGAIVACDCGCGRVWELRERTRWLTYAVWLRRVPGHSGDTVWVRLSPADSQGVLAIGERG